MLIVVHWSLAFFWEVMVTQDKVFKVVLANIGADFFDYGPGASEYLRAHLLSCGDLAERIEVDIYFQTGTDPAVFCQEILDKEPDLVGFTCYSWNLGYSEQTARCIKKKRADLPIVLGGCSFSLFRDRNDWFHGWDAVDAVAIGMGQYTLENLVRYLMVNPAGHGISDPLEGLAICQDGQLSYGPPARTPDSLMELASPYIQGALHQVARPFVEMAIGCRFECTFCSDARSSRQGLWLSNTPERIGAEIEAITRWTEADWIDAGASTANVTDQHFLDVCDGIRRGDPDQRLRYSFQLYPAISRPVQRKALEGIRVAKLMFGLQSSSPDTWAPMRRRSTIDHVHRAVDVFRGVAPMYVAMILGLPGETYDSFVSSFDEVMAVDGVYVTVHRLLVLPGTQLHQNHEALGIDFDPESRYRVTQTQTMSADDLQRAQEYVVNRAMNEGQWITEEGPPRVDWSQFEVDVDSSAYRRPEPETQGLDTSPLTRSHG